MDICSSDWPAEFVCPISLALMADPVVVSSGQSYERRCIEAWMDLGQSLCVTRSVPLDRDLIIANSGLKAAIRAMAESQGMDTPLSPPSVEQAYESARRLIQKRRLLNAEMQEEAFCAEQAPEADGIFSGEEEVRAQAVRMKGQKREEHEDWEGRKDDRLSDKMGRFFISDGSESSRLAGMQAKASETAHERKESYLKCSSSLLPYTASTMEDLDRGRGNSVRGPVRLRPPENVHEGNYRRAATDLEHRFDKFRADKEFQREGTRTTSSMTDPVIKAQPVAEAAGGSLHESHHSSRELPPHLVTKPSSYSCSEPSPSPALTPSVIDCLVERLSSEEDDKKQEAAVVELRQLSRSQGNRIPLCRTDVIKALIPLFRSHESNLQVNAVASLVNLSIETQNKVKIVRAGAIRSLVEVLQKGCPEAQVHAAGAAFSLAIADDNKHPMGALNAIPPLVQLLHSGPSGARQDAAMALYHLSLVQTNKSKLVQVGSVPKLLSLAQSRESSALSSRALIILSNVVSTPEGKAALLTLNAIPVLVRLLAIEENSKGSASIAEQAAAVLVVLAENNVRFKSLAQSAGLEGLLARVMERGSIRARAKAHALLAIMKANSPVPGEPDGASVISRQYLRMRVDGEQMNSSAF